MLTTYCYNLTVKKIYHINYIHDTYDMFTKRNLFLLKYVPQKKQNKYWKVKIHITGVNTQYLYHKYTSLIILNKFQTWITWPTRPSLRYSRDMDSNIFSLLSSSSDSSDVTLLPKCIKMHNQYIFQKSWKVWKIKFFARVLILSVYLKV